MLVLGLCYVLAAIERAGDDWRSFEQLISLVADRIYHSIDLLVEEAIAKNTLAEGDITTDKLVVQLRATRLCGLASILFLRCLKNPADADRAATCREFIEEHLGDTFLWGEGDIPLYIAVFFALRRSSATIGPDLFLFGIIDAICARNRPRKNEDNTSWSLVSPYYDGTYAVLRTLGLDEEPVKADFSGSSYCLESIVYMVSRRWWKQGLRSRWEAITHISFLKFKPSGAVDVLLVEV